MKKYIKPNMEINTIEMEEMMIITSVTAGSENLGISVSNDVFGGTEVDTKERGLGDLDSNLW